VQKNTSTSISARSLYIPIFLCEAEIDGKSRSPISKDAKVVPRGRFEHLEKSRDPHNPTFLFLFQRHHRFKEIMKLVEKIVSFTVFFIFKMCSFQVHVLSMANH